MQSSRCNMISYNNILRLKEREEKNNNIYSPLELGRPPAVR